jgi:glycosyltransferase involved in cell wall biosynthesis
MSSNTPYISILIPIKNGIEFLEEAVLSVVNQTYKNWEIIIGVNGWDKNSDTETQANNIVDKYNSKDIRVIYYEANGKSDALNKMVLDAKYDYISLLDCDDYWLENKLEKQIPFLKIYDVVGTKAQYFGDRNDFPIIPVGDFSANHNFFVLNPVINSSVVLHKSLATWDVDIKTGVEDYDLWFKLWYMQKKFYNVDEVLCMHRLYSSSSFNNSNDMYVNDLRRKWLKIIYNHEG